MNPTPAGDFFSDASESALNYYERHIGDYLKDTSHLSLLEHGIYGRLLDLYYTRECPLPEDQVMRLVGARSDDERSAVRDVLNEFFQRDGDAWKHSRCDREIERYRSKQEKAKASANARWTNAERTASERNAEAMRTHTERNAEAMLPITSNQTPDPVIERGAANVVDAPRKRSADTRGTRLPDGWQLPKAWGEWAMAESGMSRDTVRMEAEKFTDYWHAVAGAKGRKADWQATWRNWCRNAGSPKTVTSESFRERDARLAAERVAQATGGLSVDRAALRKPLPFEAGYVADVIEGESNVKRIA